MARCGEAPSLLDGRAAPVARSSRAPRAHGRAASHRPGWWAHLDGCSRMGSLKSLPGGYPDPINPQIIRKSRSRHSVRDRGVGGSNPLAPTNSSENLQNPGCQVTRFLVRRRGSEPSARCFKSGLHPESFEISRLRPSRTRLSRPPLQAKCYPPRYPTARSDTDSRS